MNAVALGERVGRDLTPMAALSPATMARDALASVICLLARAQRSPRNSEKLGFQLATG
jgi:hypothetical protein